MSTASASVPGAPAPSQLQVMGGFRLIVDGTQVAVPPAAQRLLALLGLRGPQPRALAAGTLWGSRNEARALACLRTVVWRLGRLGLIVAEPSSDLLRSPPGLTVDAHDLSRLVSGWTTPLATRSSPEELLPGWYEDWLILERERVRQGILHYVEQKAADAISVRDSVSAQHWSLVAVALDPLRESAHRLVVQAHLVNGNQVEAWRAFENARGLLRRELGIGPSRQLVHLVAPDDARSTGR